MLFEGTTISDNYVKSYWLASSGISAESGEADFSPGIVLSGGVTLYDSKLFISDGGWNAYGCAVRPVVILKSNLTVNDVHKIADQQEEEWHVPG